MTDIIKIATRQSPLALWQALEVKQRLAAIHPELQVELVKMVTKGDKLLDSPLAKIGGKGLFVKELEIGLLNGEADIAVHSMKDVPAVLPEGLHLPVIMQRENPFDAFVSNTYERPEDLPEGAVVGTSSLRRQCQLQERFPHLQVRFLRGNVNTRLGKLDAGEYDAIILAAAGLMRLEMHDRIRCTLSAEHSLPAVGQGAIGIECREGDQKTEALLAPLADAETTSRVTAERAMNHRLNGGCQVPIAGFSEIQDDVLSLRGLVGYPDGREIFRAEHSGPVADAEAIGRNVAEQLLAQGAGAVLREIGILTHE